MVVKVASRQSDLARIQALTFGQILKEKHPDVGVEHYFRESLGDKNLKDPLWKMPGQGVFTEDFYQDLVDGTHDVVVHSWKDLPTEPREKTEIFATLERADMRDLLLFKKENFEQVQSSKKLRVYSSSPRRAYNLTPFLKEAMPFEIEEVEFASVRGNVPTRFQKLIDGEADALIVAKAALDRMLQFANAEIASEFAEMRDGLIEKLSQLRWMVLPLSVNPCAAAQGALAIEIRSDREDLKTLLKTMNCCSTQDQAEKERKILSSYGGGCHQKIGISVLDRPYGELTFLKGLTDDGKVLSGKQLKRKNLLNWPRPESGKEELFPLSMKEAQFFERESLDISLDELHGKNLWVARSNALPEGYVPEVSQQVWCSGLRSWKKLAARGVWVNGCAEGLGEREVTQLDNIGGNRKSDEKIEWLKLTHEQGFGENKLATYKLKDAELLPKTLLNLKNKKYFFWASFSQFEKAASESPEIIEQGYHGCGPGHTYDLIEKFVEDKFGKDLVKERLAVFLGQRQWLEEVLEGPVVSL